MFYIYLESVYCKRFMAGECSLPILAIHFSLLSFVRKHIRTGASGYNNEIFPTCTLKVRDSISMYVCVYAYII